MQVNMARLLFQSHIAARLEMSWDSQPSYPFHHVISMSRSRPREQTIVASHFITLSASSHIVPDHACMDCPDHHGFMRIGPPPFGIIPVNRTTDHIRFRRSSSTPIGARIRDSTAYRSLKSNINGLRVSGWQQIRFLRGSIPMTRHFKMSFLTWTRVTCQGRQ
jgi:hypothetical protein